MARRNEGTRKNSRNRPSANAKRISASVVLARKGVGSSEDFRNLMGAMMTDVVQGNVSPDVVNAACNAGRGLLRMVELEYKATATRSGVKRVLPMSKRIATISA